MSETADGPGAPAGDSAAARAATKTTARPLLLKGPLLKFVAVGITNNLIGYLTFVALSLWGMSALGAVSISYLLGMFISFAGNRKWTFGHNGGMGPAVLRFIAANVVCYGLNVGILALFVTRLGLPQIPVQFVALGVGATCTFLLMRLWVFRPDQGADHG